LEVVNANVYLKRLEDLILAEERIFLPNPPLDQILLAISIKNGYFSWNAKAESPTLSNINMEILVGCLVAVVGSTGERKTSLVSAMLEEIPPSRDSTIGVRDLVIFSCLMSMREAKLIRLFFLLKSQNVDDIIFSY